MTSFLRRFRKARGGNIAILFAICAPLLICVAGFAVDFANAAYTKRTLDEALDAAVLTSVSQSTAASGDGYNDTAWLASFGVNMFTADIAKLNLSVSPNINVSKNTTGGVIAQGSYSYRMPTAFSSLIGINNILLSSSATSTANPVTYINYYIIVDNSQSMGIASTTADQAALFARTKAAGNAGCTFGCHITMQGQTQTNESIAHNMSPRINLRIDAAITAIQSVINDAQAAAGGNQNIKIGLYTMQKNPKTGTLVVPVKSPPSSDYPSLLALSSTIDLGDNVGPWGSGDTDFANQLPLFSNMVAQNGDGTSALKPKNYVFIITDGLQDVDCSSCYTNHGTKAFDPSLCDSLKTKSTVGVIYTTFLPIYNNNDPAQGLDNSYVQLVQPYASSIKPNLQACSSGPSFYFEASDGAGIDQAMKTLFASTVKTARIVH